MPSWAKSDIPDFGTTYWQNGDRDVLVLKFDGYRLKIGSSMVPCFVGTLDRHSDFVGGGLGFGGAYVPQRVKLDVIHAYAGAVVVHGSLLGDDGSTYWRSTKKRASYTMWTKGSSVKALFRYCGRR